MSWAHGTVPGSLGRDGQERPAVRNGFAPAATNRQGRAPRPAYTPNAAQQHSDTIEGFA